MIPAPDELDRLVDLLLRGLETDDLVAERLIRMGVYGERSIQRAAQRLGYRSVNAMGGSMRARSLPPAGHLLMWGRLLSAMYAWRPACRGSGRSLGEVARVGGWAGNAQLSNSLRRYSGTYPLAWYRGNGTLSDLCLRFLQTETADADAPTQL